MKLGKITLAVLALAFAAVGCKSFTGGDEPSKIKTLDNFAAGSTVSENACGADSTPDPIDDKVASIIDGLSLIQADEDSKESVAAALGALPLNLVNLYFATGNRIVISDKAFDGEPDEGIDDCSIARDEGRLLDGPVRVTQKSELASCIILESQNGGEGRLGIYIRNNSAAIRHALVRRVSQAVSIHLARLSTDADGLLNIGEQEDAPFTEWKMSLLSALDKDIADLASEDTVNYRSLRRSLSASEFSHYVFAEAMDSYYCSPRTRDAMTSKFANAYAQFVQLDGDLRSIWADQLVEKSGKSSGKSLGGIRPVRRALYGVGRAGVLATRGTAQLGAGAVRGTGRVAFGTGRVLIRGSGAAVRGGANVIQGVGQGVGGALQYRSDTGYLFPRLNGVPRR